VRQLFEYLGSREKNYTLAGVKDYNFGRKW